jgi:hypothetical protein
MSLKIINDKTSACQRILPTTHALDFTLYDLGLTLYASQIKSEGGEGMSLL